MIEAAKDEPKILSHFLAVSSRPTSAAEERRDPLTFVDKGFLGSPTLSNAKESEGSLGMTTLEDRAIQTPNSTPAK